MTTTSRVVENDNAPGDLVALEKTLKDATAKKPADAAAPTKSNEQQQSTVQKPDWIQDKFWTGNLEESTRKQAEAYVPLQSQYGRMANDLGAQRKLTDRILNLEKPSDGQPPQPTKVVPKVDARSLVEKPTETLNGLIDQRLKEEREARELEERKRAMQVAEENFMSRHADADAVVQSKEFSDWVTSSPLRKRAAALVAQGNFVVADELLTEFKALKGQGPAPSEDANRGATPAEKDAATKAALESAAQAGGAGAKGPIYRRADLIKLQLEKPEVYRNPVFQAEILRAYAEKRVK